jgi:serine protease Do
MGNTMSDTKSSNLSTLQSYLIQSIEHAKTSVVSITASKDVKFYVDDPSQLNGPGSVHQQIAQVGWWSGIIVSKNGYILTNKHVVQDTWAKYSVILSDGKTYNVDKIRFDDLLDLAILKIIDSEGVSPKDLQVATFLPIDTQVDVGQFALTIGNTLSKYPNTVTLWIIGGKSKKLTINGNNLYIWLYQTDAQANPGNSGWPLIDIDGNIIGMTTAIDEWEGLTFALPLSQEFIAWTLKSIETFWSISRPIIGIQYVEITPTLQAEKKINIANGIYIKDVISDLPAREAWLQVDDSIVSINGKEISHHLPFLYQLYTFIPGDTVSLHIVRGGKPIDLQIVLWWNTQK